MGAIAVEMSVAVPSAGHLVAGTGTNAEGRVDVGVLATEIGTPAPQAMGNVVWHQVGGETITIGVDCAEIYAPEPTGFGIDHRLWASGLGDDGVRYYMRLQIDGDAGGQRILGLGTTLGEDPAPCDASFVTGLGFAGIFVIEP